MIKSEGVLITEDLISLFIFLNVIPANVSIVPGA